MSARLVRKQVLITQEQDVRVKALSAATGRTEADLFREAIAQRLEQAASLDWRKALDDAHRIWADRSDAEMSAQAAQFREGWHRRYERVMKGRTD
jgi:predicted DNA-binding protein